MTTSDNDPTRYAVLLKCEHCKKLFGRDLDDVDVRYMKCPYCRYETVVIVQDNERRATA